MRFASGPASILDFFAAGSSGCMTGGAACTSGRMNGGGCIGGGMPEKKNFVIQFFYERFYMRAASTNHQGGVN